MWFSHDQNVATSGFKFYNSAGTETFKIQGDGNVVVNGGLQLNNVPGPPACIAATRGMIWFFPGGAGVKDQCQVCAKDAADVYAWRIIY